MCEGSPAEFRSPQHQVPSCWFEQQSLQVGDGTFQQQQDEWSRARVVTYSPHLPLGRALPVSLYRSAGGLCVMLSYASVTSISSSKTGPFPGWMPRTNFSIYFFVFVL